MSIIIASFICNDVNSRCVKAVIKDLIYPSPNPTMS